MPRKQKLLSQLHLLSKSNKTGFTIVELLIVIIVIGVLVSITMVSYTAITSRVNIETLKKDLSDASARLKKYYYDHGAYPASLDGDNCPIDHSNSTYCLKPSEGVSYEYKSNSPYSIFVLGSTKSSKSYFVTQEGKQLSGPIPVLYLDAGIKSSYPESGAIWYDISGDSNNHNGTITSGATYTSNDGGAFNFNGNSDTVDSKINYVSGGFLPTGDSVRTIMFWFKPNAGMSGTNIAFGYGCSNFEGRNLTTGCTSQGVGRYVGAYATTGSIGLHLESCAVSGPTTPSPTTNWHLYTAIFNGNNTITFYVDGANVRTVTPGCTINSAAGLGYSVGAGRWGYYNGSIGVLRVYNSALSEDEVNNSYNELRSRFGV